MVNIIENEQLIRHVFEYDVILFGMGINNSSGNGFSKELFVNFPEISDSENITKYGDMNKYGTINETKINDTIFCSCYVYNNTCKKTKQDVYINYDHLKKVLEFVSNRYGKKKIACPIIGKDRFDGNGDKEVILSIFNGIFTNVDITLYDFEQIDHREYYYHKMCELLKDYKERNITKEEYLFRKKEINNEKKYGIYQNNLDISKK